MGPSVLRIADQRRRDRLLLLNAFAIVLLTLLGAAGESLGTDRRLKVNTAKYRTHSLFRQGCTLKTASLAEIPIVSSCLARLADQHKQVGTERAQPDACAPDPDRPVRAESAQ
jgi:hypothetical protein